MQKVSVIIPVYNEIDTLEKILDKVENVDLCSLLKEIIIVDDYSTDGTRDLLKGFEDKYKVYYHQKNMGKGAAIRTALTFVSGDIVVIQDADLEYNPDDYVQLIQIIVDEKADVVYGSRFLGTNLLKSFSLSHFLGNKLLTILTNIFYNTALTDMETCYKAFKAQVIKNINIKSDRFDFEPEITAKILKRGFKVCEVPISYYGRKHNEGKKITWKDGISAIAALIKYRFVD